MFIYITTPEQAVSHCNAMLETPPNIIGVDTETTGLDCFNDRLKLVQIAVSGHAVYIFDIDKIGTDGVKALETVLTLPIIKIFHNGKFDLKFLQTIGISISDNIFDTMLAEQTIISGLMRTSFKLSDVARKYLGITLDKEFQTSDWTRALTIEQLEYASRDASILLELYPILLEELERLNLMETAELENKALIPTVKMELVGFRIDRKSLKDLDVFLLESKAALIEKLKGLLPGVNNYNSPAQVKTALQALGLNITSTDKDELKKYKDDYPVIDTLLQYKKITKRISLLEKLVGTINPKTGRIHELCLELRTI